MKKSFFPLRGLSQDIEKIPDQCPDCKAQEFFQQPDFERKSGVWILMVCALMSFYLMAEGYNWWLQWSPMLLALILDRVFLILSPKVLICYKCEKIFRSLHLQDEINKFPDFDLEVSDRYKYAENNSTQEQN